MSQTRIYVVNTPNGKRLVDAGNKSQAVNHVASTTITASVASQADLVALLPTVPVEKANAVTVDAGSTK